MTTKLKRISLRAKSDLACVFNNLGHIIDIDLLREHFHRLDGNKAVGIDKVSKEQYGKRLDENLLNLISRIRNGSYKPRASRLVEIPKEDGSKRPLAICGVEDKIVQSAVSSILSAIYEPSFLPCSFGFRPGLNCHDALIELREQADQNADGAIIEIDIRKYFNSIPHQGLLEILSEKISDRRFIALIKVLLQTPIMVDGQENPNETGCPQGSIVSPILANLYLHHVIDSWFNDTVCKHIIGRAKMVRYADDMVFYL